ncbi:multiple epidermal growth factor-like domains protein 8 [Ischnura elegans]|uniref:multiple epidermal growth factor-like domains protein 8 n=1 Tax=Ischnura elegans TaxID=197161 RepID=UPI001ED87C4C|nr:multiple epidermal growth factor-like domains protein 8 [Ischnura elegans]
MFLSEEKNVSTGFDAEFCSKEINRNQFFTVRRFVARSSILQVALTFVLSFLGIVGGAIHGSTPCDRSRKILTESWGVITDGPPGSNYTQDSHCEWLIKANNSKQFITLTFSSMGTECSYDYIFVHDGDSFEAPLLASLSGRTKPQVITASSGSMLILLYSDTNYVLDGFQAEYSISDCPRNCSGHGTCVDKLKDWNFKCICGLEDSSGITIPYGGPDCSKRLCPENCGISEGHGICSYGSSKAQQGKRHKEAKCICNKGYSGESCSLSKSDATGNRWHWLSRSRGPHVAAHSSVYVEGKVDSLFVFGGFDLNQVSGQLWAYRFSESRWELIDGSSEERDKGKGEEYTSEEESKSSQPIISGHIPLTHGTSPIVSRELTFSVTSNSTVSIRAKTRTERAIQKTNGIASSKESSEHFLTGSQWFRRVARDADDRKEGLSVEEEAKSAEYGARPSPRYGHAACRYPGGFVLYGGKLANGTLSDELWFYDVEKRKWSLRGMKSKFRPPPLTRHSLTLGRDGWIYLFGGSTVPSKEGDGVGAGIRGIGAPGEFSSSLFRIRLLVSEPSLEDESWEELHPRGGKTLDVRVAAHSTVYYAPSNSLLVFGGIVAGGTARFSRLSDRLFAYHLGEAQWAELRGYPAQRPVLRDPYVPGERAFHTATIVGNYLVVFGGYSHRHNKEEICYDNQMYFYHLGCHTWISHDILPQTDKDWSYPKSQGVFAHTMDLRNGNTLLVYGGYHGNVNNDLLAYSLPPTLAPALGVSPEKSCSNHRKILECTSDPECGWCSADETCYGRTLTANCTTNLQTTRCPGICPALGDCHSCLIHGNMNNEEAKSSAHPVTPVSVSHKLRLGQCTWCVQNARCHHKDDNFGVCGTQEDNAAGAGSGDGPPVGWWGPQGTEVIRVEECRTMDRRPGLTFLKYKHPANYTHPDYVGIINATTADFNLPGAFGTRTELPLGGEVRARLLGFLWPPQTSSLAPSGKAMVGSSGATIRICASFSSASLSVSRPHTSPPEMVLVANLTAENRNCTLAIWPQSPGAPVILERTDVLPNAKPNAHNSPSWNKKHLVDFEAKKTARGSGPSSAHHHSKMELLYSYNSEDSNKVFTFEYLEPYSNGSCSSYLNCLHCLSDSSCGWCETIGKCMSRSVNETEECLYPVSATAPSAKRDWHYLTLLPSSCPNCSNFVSCETCMGADDNCEWWMEDARCARRGRSADAVVSISQCPSPCHHRTSCSECLGEPGRCVWCDSTQECFSFSVYTSEYQFGLCREWVDQDYSYYHHVQHGSVSSSFQQNISPLTRHHRLGGVLNSRSKDLDRLGSRNSPAPEPKGVLSTEQCRSCERHLNCSSCLRSLECGWCYSTNDPTVGVCVRGDFMKPQVGSCAIVLASMNHTSKLFWSHSATEATVPPNVYALARMLSLRSKIKRQERDVKLDSEQNQTSILDALSSIDADLPTSSSASTDPEEYLITSSTSPTTSTSSMPSSTASMPPSTSVTGKEISSPVEQLQDTTTSSSLYVVTGSSDVSDEVGNDSPSRVSAGEADGQEPVGEVWQWAYAECPDVDECALGRHQCNAKAECHNTHGSYVCQCKRGYIGDGVTHCNKTCYEECKNGYCDGEPEFRCQCFLGWTGPDCATDCGCHNHSTCDGSTRPAGVEDSRPIGPGHCDYCQEWTQGKFCEECRPGGYRYRSKKHSCQPCQCNGHGDKEKGLCDANTGSCFCTGHTYGEACESCEKGYFGDPSNGGTCFSGCGPRVVLSNEMSGGIGSESHDQFASLHASLFNSSSYDGEYISPPQDCLWIIDPRGSLAKANGSKSDVLEPVVIQLDLKKGSVTGIKCGEGSVHVYDGLPAFVASLPSSSTSPSIPLSVSSLHGHSLGAFCDRDSTYPLTLEAKSGIMSVFYQKRGSSPSNRNLENFVHRGEYFKATFRVLACPDDCPDGRVCHKSPSGVWGYCSCPNGFTGPNCERKLCDSGVCPSASGFQIDRIKSEHHSQLSTLFDSGRLADSLDHLRRILPRFGHSLVMDRRSALWIFGGYSLSNGLLNDIRMFDTRNNTWMQVTVDSTGKASMPQGRYFHAAAAVHSRREVFIYGGLASEGRALDDLWKFGIKNHRWTKIETNHGPPPVAGHTLTLRWGDVRFSGAMGGSSSWRKVMAGSEGREDEEREDEERKEEDVLAEEGLMAWGEDSLVLIGGFSPNEGFLHLCWEFHLRWGLWRPLNTSGSPPTGVYGHSTVYHAPTESFYVYGGYSYGTDGLFVSDRLYSLHYPSGFWSILPPFEEYNPPGLHLPGARFLHSAVTTNEYMLVLGGLTHPQNTSGGIAAYVYSCNLWIRLEIKDPDLSGDNLGWMLGQTAVLLNPVSPTTSRSVGGSGSVHVYVVGGFEEGGTRAKVTQMTFPVDLCSTWQGGGKDKCRGTLGCSYCGVIVHSDSGAPSKGNISMCYSSSRSLPEECKGGGIVTTNNGAKCDREWLEGRNCEEYTTCAECLARWPSHPSGKQVCQWCSNCPRGRCVRRGQDCNERAASNRAPGGISSSRGRGTVGGGCNVRQTPIMDVSFCPGLGCPASDCAHCSKMRGCLWTRQVLVTHELGLKVSAEPVYEWSCVRDDVSERSSIRLISSSPPAPCPPRCSSYQTCSECLSAPGGGEGGWRECRWSTLLGECISPSYQPLYCVGGVCGLVLHGSPTQCPSPCSHFKQCATCLRDPRCGWCSLESSDGKSGQGVCSEGSLQGPSDQPVSSLHVCHEIYVRAKGNITVNFSNVGKLNSTTTLGKGSVFSWHYLNCPPEDECKNGHHSCHPESQECVDLPEGFSCVCGKGYKEEERLGCAPVCQPSCIHGWCAKPNLCQCDFGYVGQDCSIKCQCNEHSNCLGPDKLDHCIECHNNTMGPQCERCLPKFVGDPTNGGQCVPCLDYCNGHTPHCINASDGSTSSYQYSGKYMEVDESTFPKWGSLMNTNGESVSRTVAVCIGCANGTAGEKCEGCLPGYFRGSTDHRQPCRLCECHGHGDICDPVTGENCNCQNNTESDPQCLSGATNVLATVGNPPLPLSGQTLGGVFIPSGHLSSKTSHHGSSNTVIHQGKSGILLGNQPLQSQQTQCWKLQCSKCREYYVGTPTNGHQCYRQMVVDSEYCFDPKTQEDCSGKPHPLLPGKTSFLVVQPRFMNVDIRFTVDVTQGGLDLFLSPREDAFTIQINSTTGDHMVELDPRFRIRHDDPSDDEVNSSKEDESDKIGKEESPTQSSNDPRLSARAYPQRGKSVAGPISLLPRFRVTERQASGLATYITVDDPYSILVVRNLRNRLVLTLPQSAHDLGSTRFHIALLGRGPEKVSGEFEEGPEEREFDGVGEHLWKSGSGGWDQAARSKRSINMRSPPSHATTFGIAFFRQDQLHIDLFVFFSVFFSCFFLFLASVVVAWRAKRAADARRARRQHVVQMLHLAQRPFASISLILDSPGREDELYQCSPCHSSGDESEEVDCGGDGGHQGVRCRKHGPRKWSSVPPEHLSHPGHVGNSTRPSSPARTALSSVASGEGSGVAGSDSPSRKKPQRCSQWGIMGEKWRPGQGSAHRGVRPVAVEPTEDGVAGVATVFVKLPGGQEAPVRLALASALILLSRVYPVNGRAFLRRRSSGHHHHHHQGAV